MAGSARSLTATTSKALGWRSSHAFTNWRPIRPKPFTPTRTVMAAPPLDPTLAPRAGVCPRLAEPLSRARGALLRRDHRTDHADVAAQARGHDLARRARDLEGPIPHAAAHGDEDVVGLVLRDASADDDASRVEHVHEPYRQSLECGFRVRDELAGPGVARALGAIHVLRVRATELLGQVPPAGERLDATVGAAAAARSCEGDRPVADLARGVRG